MLAISMIIENKIRFQNCEKTAVLKIVWVFSRPKKEIDQY